jgi:hypothetical protein
MPQQLRPMGAFSSDRLAGLPHPRVPARAKASACCHVACTMSAASLAITVQARYFGVHQG